MPDWIIDKLLATGVTWCLGDDLTQEQIYLCTELCLAVTTGGKAFGHFQATQGDVLYLETHPLVTTVVPVLRWRYADAHATCAQGTTIVQRPVPPFGPRLLDYLEAWITSVAHPRLIVLGTSATAVAQSAPEDWGPPWDAIPQTALTHLTEGRQLAILALATARDLPRLTACRSLTHPFQDPVAHWALHRRAWSGVMDITFHGEAWREGVLLDWDEDAARWMVWEEDATGGWTEVGAHDEAPEA